MEDIIWKLKNNNSDKKNTRHTKQILFSTQKNITNEEKGFLLHLKMVHFHCLKNIHQTRLDGETVKWIHQNFKFRTLLPLFQREEKTEKERSEDIVNKLNELVAQKHKIIKK